VATPTEADLSGLLVDRHRTAGRARHGVDADGVRMVTVDLDEQPALRVTSRYEGDDEPCVGTRVAVRFVDGHGGPFPVFARDDGAARR
jgi:hypothetical protein